MGYLEAKFENFEFYKAAAEMWNLDFRLLSKGKFDASLQIYTNEKFQIGRTKLNGKIQQLGLCPIGFVTIAIPANIGNEFIWLNTKSSGKELLIYSDSGEIDGASFDGFDMYVISIEKEYLLETINWLGYNNTINFFDGVEKRIPLQEPFINDFYNKANYYLSITQKTQELQNSTNSNANILLFDDLLSNILKFIEGAVLNTKYTSLKKRTIALKKALEYIEGSINDTIKMSKLCEYSGVSERTLQYAFLERFQVSPKEYINSVKLHKIRNRLSAEEYGQAKISDIAIDFGFWHMSKFSQDYKNKFGELPTNTLKRKSILF